jgi:capsular polysaccharide transport system permease protein
VNALVKSIGNRLGPVRSFVRGARDSHWEWVAIWPMVVIPALTAFIYYGLIASPIYVSEAKFVVRGVNGQNIGGLAALFRTLGIARSVDDTFAVQNFMRSRDAARQLDQKLGLRKIYGVPEVDFVARFEGFWRQPQFESLYQYYLGRVEVIHSDTTGITTLRALAFTPEDSHKIALALLRASEELVNRMNTRATNDAVTAAQRVMAGAEQKVIDAQKQLTDFRNRADFVDPVSASTRSFQLISRISGELADARVRRNELARVSPSHPSLPGLNNRIAALEIEANNEKRKVVGTDTSLTMKMSEFERLMLQREFTDRALSAALDSLESARQEARRKQLYIETIAQPNLPDKASEPKRFLNILTTIVFSLTLFGMCWLLIAGGREHAHAL